MSQYSVTEILLLLVMLLSLLWLTHVADVGNEKTAMAVHEIEAYALNSHQANQCKDLIDKLKELSIREYHSCHLFTVNRAFSVTFMSSLFTFTALLYQIFTGIPSGL